MLVLPPVPPGAFRVREDVPVLVAASPSRIERIGADGSSCLALRDGATPLLWPRLTSACASSAPLSAASSMARGQISQGKTRDRRSIYPPHLRRTGPDDIGLRVFWPSRPPALRLVCGSCPSGRSFACGFLPTTHRCVAVAVRLGVPVIRVPRGLPPPSHFPTRFRYRLPAPATALRAMPGAPKKGAGVSRPRSLSVSSVKSV
jgi:hypothetical protein